MKRLLSISIFLIATLFSQSAVAQNKITFQVNLKPLLADSIFVPGRDVALLKGDIFPLTPTNRMQLTDNSSPADSIYSIEINFPYTAVDKKLTYNFILKMPEKEITESRQRTLTIRKGDRELAPLYFDAFAW